jgi:hypothetical protein
MNAHGYPLKRIPFYSPQIKNARLCVCVCVCVLLGTEPRASIFQGKHSLSSDGF